MKQKNEVTLSCDIETEIEQLEQKVAPDGGETVLPVSLIPKY
jgi:hypothetical protein